MVPFLFVAAFATDGRPDLRLTFATEWHAAGGYGHDGDGCTLAEAALESKPTVSSVWFDAKGRRLAQTNPGLHQVDPDPGLTVIGRWGRKPPTELDLEQETFGAHCFKEPLPPSYCKNGSQVCPPDFGNFGDLFTPFTAILGMYYFNTSFLESTAEADVWQWEVGDPHSCTRICIFLFCVKTCIVGETNTDA
jgi:hypothetical protein